MLSTGILIHDSSSALSIAVLFTTEIWIHIFLQSESTPSHHMVSLHYHSDIETICMATLQKESRG